MPADPVPTPVRARARLRRLLGGIPASRIALAGRHALEAEDGVLAWRLDLRRGDGTAIRAFLCAPAERGGPCPALLYCHAHGNRHEIGADELVAGRPALVAPYGPALARAGFASLAIDMPCFGARRDETEGAAAKRHFWRGSTLFGEMIADLRGALALLAGLEEADPRRLGALGLSMGASHAFWLGALEPRLCAIVQLCVLADLAALIETGAHDLHGPYLTVPGLVRAMPTGAIAGLAAPRPHFVAVGAEDPLTPPAAFARARADLEQAYRAAGAAAALEFHVAPATGHRETPAMRAAVIDFLRRHLTPGEAG